jgi:hypothetical protein
MDSASAQTFCLGLLNNHPGQNFPIPEAIKVEHAAEAQIVPELTLSRRATSAKAKGSAATLNDLVLVELHFRYGKRRIEQDSPLDWISYNEQGTVVRMPRDPDFEANCTTRLEALGFEPAPSLNRGELLCLDAGGYRLSSKAPTTWEELLDQVFPTLESAGWKIAFAPGFRLNSAQQAALYSYSEAQPQQSWFEYTVGVSFKGMRFSVIDLISDFIHTSSSNDLPDMLRELAQSNLALPLEDGEFLVLPGKLLKNILSEVFELLGQTPTNGSLQLSRAYPKFARHGRAPAPHDRRIQTGTTRSARKPASRAARLPKSWPRLATVPPGIRHTRHFGRRHGTR